MSKIDVSECEYYQECMQFGDGEEEYHICNDYKNPTTYCQDSYNCYYKQLQQLKQENDNLKQECDLYKTWYRAKHDDLKNFLGKLKAENEKLRNKLKMQKNKQIVECGKRSFKNILHKHTLSQQCLDAIEEIVKGTCRKRCTNDCLGTKKHCGYGKILQLIKQAKKG